MSKGGSPAHFFSENIGNYFDPAFTEEISSKMLVPDKISLIGENSAQVSGRSQILNEQQKFIMNVPERILVAGGDKHIGGRETLPELRLESSLPLNSQTSIQLSTPPSVITLSEHHYPTIVDDAVTESRKKHRHKMSANDESAHEQQSLQESSSTDISPHSPEEELALLRRQVKHLSRRVLAIEQDNQQRQQREIVLYSIGIIYFLLKGLAWLHKNW